MRLIGLRLTGISTATKEPEDNPQQIHRGEGRNIGSNQTARSHFEATPNHDEEAVTSVKQESRQHAAEHEPHGPRGELPGGRL